jgi:hypothetical protein
MILQGAFLKSFSVENEHPVSVVKIENRGAACGCLFFNSDF